MVLEKNEHEEARYEVKRKNKVTICIRYCTSTISRYCINCNHLEIRDTLHQSVKKNNIFCKVIIDRS